jgi:hypothetical protein
LRCLLPLGTPVDYCSSSPDFTVAAAPPEPPYFLSCLEISLSRSTTNLSEKTFSTSSKERPRSFLIFSNDSKRRVTL